MKAFPMFIKTTGRRAIIVGGGEQAAQKARLLLKTDARLILAAGSLDEELTELVATGRAEHFDGPLTEAFFAGAAMVFIASGCFAIDAAAHAIAKAARCAVNVVDQPHLCDLTTPSLVDRDPVVIAIGTEGTSPVLARLIKTQMEESLPQTLGGLAALAGRLRAAVTRNVPRNRRRAFWRWVFAEEPATLWADGRETEAAERIKAVIADRGETGDSHAGSIALIGAGSGARDLLTLRAVQRLQEADVIFYERRCDEALLELARRDAERVYVGPHRDAAIPSVPQGDRFVLSEAKRGSRVVRLLGLSGAELARALARHWAMAQDAGIALEHVPGVGDGAALAAAETGAARLSQRS